MFVSFVTCYFSPVTWHLPCLAYFLSYVIFYWEQRLPSSNLYATLTPTQTSTSQHRLNWHRGQVKENAYILDTFLMPKQINYS